MEIKGTAVKSTRGYIAQHFSTRYQEWLDLLPTESKEYYQEVILSGNMYPIVEALLKPTEVAGDLFFDGDYAKAGYELGKSSAVEALSGIYKIFVKIASVDFVLKRVKSIFSTYYSSGRFDIVSNENNRIEFFVSGFSEGENLIFDRIAGWIDGVFSVISTNKYKVLHEVIEENNRLSCKIFVNFE